MEDISERYRDIGDGYKFELDLSSFRRVFAFRAPLQRRLWFDLIANAMIGQ